MSDEVDVVAFNSSGRAMFSTAGASDAGLQAALLSQLSNASKEQSLLAFEHGGRKLVAVALRRKAGSVVILHEDDEALALFDFISAVDIAFDILNHFVTTPYEGVTVVDKDAILRYVSPVHEKFFGLPKGSAIGRPVQEVIENTRLHIVSRTGKAEIGQVQQLGNVQRVVNRIPIHRDGKTIGAIGRVMFKAPEEVHELSRQISSLRAEVSYYKRELVGLRAKTFGLDQIVGESDQMLKLKADIRKVAPLNVPVFIAGESGTGKELVAHAIHNLSRRGDRPMVVVNCGALPASLVESELFGHEAGAFTGAKRTGHTGKFEMANKSSLFLDEIGDLPADTQVKFLRVLEGGRFERVGSNSSIDVDFRLISATNRNLNRMIKEESYRADLFFRINGVTLRIPPLRDRRGDIPLLVRHFIPQIASRVGSEVRSITPDALAYLQGLSWPGNVRQFYHELQRAIIFADGPELTRANFGDIQAEVEEGAAEQPGEPSEAVEQANEGSPTTLKAVVGRTELELVRQALERNNGNKKKVAEELGISRSYLYKLLDSL